MSDKPERIDREEMTEQVRAFVAHIGEHDPSDVSAAFCLMASDAQIEGKDGMHVCSMIAGNPQQIADLLIQAIDKLQEASPEFREAFQALAARKALTSMVEGLKQMVKENESAEKAKPLVDEVIKKMMNTPPTDSDTKH